MIDAVVIVIYKSLNLHDIKDNLSIIMFLSLSLSLFLIQLVKISDSAIIQSNYQYIISILFKRCCVPFPF